MDNIIVIAVVAVIFGAAAGYIYKKKKQGSACIGCPESSRCGSHNRCTSCSGCACDQK